MRALIAGALLLACCGTVEEKGEPSVLDPSRPRKHCDLRTQGQEAEDRRCRERVDPLGTFNTYCEAAGGIARDGACPRDKAVMGCVYGAELDWWYGGGITKEDVARICFYASGALISP